MGNNLTITDIIPEHIEALTIKLKNMGANIKIKENSVIVSKVNNLKCIDIKTQGYPGFPTDLQQPMTVLLTYCDGSSILEENIYENRFKNIKYLKNMGANININGNKIHVQGPTILKGCEVLSTDLRAGACMILAALSARGITTIKQIEHVLRGYENIVCKLTNVGAKISIEEYN